MIIWSCGRKIKIANGRKSQTVNIYTNDLIHGKYDYIIRMQGPENFVDGLEIERKNFKELKELISYLQEKHFGIIEKTTGSDVFESYREEEYFKKPKKHFNFKEDDWLNNAVNKTENILNEFLKKFIMYPYLHRVEHSIHCDLYNMLLGEDIFNKRVKIGSEETQIIHKEWPEYIPRPEKGNRRGNVDLVILSPTNCLGSSISDFIYGRIEAPIVIEMGLNYSISHFTDDFEKLKNSRIHKGYLIHLSRKEQIYECRNFEEILLQIEDTYENIKVGYVKHEPGKVRFKLINDNSISVNSI
jgi:hypothetical protein